MRRTILLAACLALASPALADIDSDGPRDRATGQLHSERYGDGPRNGTSGGYDLGNGRSSYDPGPQPSGANRRATNPD